MPAAPTRPVLLGTLLLSALASCGGDSGPADNSLTPVTSGPHYCTDDLASAPPALTVLGAESGDFLADRFSLASGDFNGDGLDDVLMGAPLADGPENSRNNSGEAYVVLGSAAPAATIDLALAAADLSVFGENPDDNLGFTVAAGDVNGDSIDDVLLGARFARSGSKVGAGSVYIIFGRRDLPREIDLTQGEQDVTLLGPNSGDLLGAALGSGDVNGDGVSDLILGASGAAGPEDDRPSAGEVHVVLGSSALGGTVDLADSEPFYTVYGAAAGDNLPNHLTSADLNGDGRDELLSGAPFADGAEGQQDAGRAYLIEVPADGGALDLGEKGKFTQVIGAEERDSLGFYVAAGDLNGDGKEDAVIGARDADGPGNGRNNAGEALILYGSDDLSETVDLARDKIDLVIDGIDPGDSLGFTVASGDLNGDGLADVLVGAPIGDGCENDRLDAGEVYILLSREDFPSASDLAVGGYQRSLFGIDVYDELGFSLASGDFNGDGLDDILVGALLADGPDNSRAEAGEAYIVLSKAP